MNMLAQGIILDSDHWKVMENDVAEKFPEEACGIVIGEGATSRLVIPITNILHSHTKFRMEPQEELNAFYLAEQKGMDVLAIYHSHPHGSGKPSPTDFSELSFPGVIYLIWFTENDLWQCRGFLMHSDREAVEVPITILPE